MTCQPGGKPKFVDRDKNAAANILLVGESAERPKPFRRSSKEDSLFNKAPEAGHKSFVLGESD